MNDSIGENGLVPSLLVFGFIPRYPALNTELPKQKVRMEVIAAAQMAMNSIIAERRIATALAADAQILVITAPPSDPRVPCQPNAVDVGLLQCDLAYHLL
jgi:hypothetical protein